MARRGRRLRRLSKRFGMNSIKFRIPGNPKLPNQLLHKHWAIVHSNSHKWRTLVAIATLPFKAFKCDIASLELIRGGSREPDFDGLVGSFKCVIDGLVKCGVLKDDKPSNIASCQYRFIKTKRDATYIEVGVTKV